MSPKKKSKITKEEAEELRGYDALIAAFQIFREYADPVYPTHCEHDALMVPAPSFEGVLEADREILDALGWVEGDHDGFVSYRYGSC